MMTKPTIHGTRRTLTASSILEAIGGELSLIREQDGLTWKDVGRVLGKSEDQAAKYADGSAEMGIVAFAFAKREWNGRFTGALDKLVHGARHHSSDDRSKLTAVLRAAAKIAEALENDEQMDPEEVRDARAQLEDGRDAIEELLGKLQPRAVA